MSVYTVHEPPRRDADASADPDRVVFVRDGFYFWAMLFGPLWLLWRRLWLALLFYVIAWIVVEGGLFALKANETAHAAIGLLFAILLGMEASSLWRWTLDRRGYKNLGVVVGDDLESAERRFFQTRRDVAPKPAPKTVPSNYGPKSSENGNDVIGLFPEPGGSR
jgi:uncharacterized protein DUF2628